MQQPTVRQVAQATRVVVFDENLMAGTTEYRLTGYGDFLDTQETEDLEGLTARELLKCSDVMELWAGAKLIWEYEGGWQAFKAQLPE